MEGQRCVNVIEESTRPIFSFARLRRYATVDTQSSADPPSPASTPEIKGTPPTSSSMSSINTNLNSILNCRNNNNNAHFNSGNHSFETASSSTPSPLQSPCGRHDFIPFSSASLMNHPSSGKHSRKSDPSRPRSVAIDDRQSSTDSTESIATTPKVHSLRNNFKTRSSSTPPAAASDAASPVDSTKARPTRPRPLNKTTKSALVFSPQKEKPIFRRYLSLIVFPSSLKQIPFTVPTSPHATSSRAGFRRTEQRSLDDGSPSGRSEPTSPTAIAGSSAKRPSVEIPGAYALGTIDPSLYKVADEDDHYDIPPDHIGRVWFATEYERETEKLMVTLIKAKNLPSRTLGSDNACDPFVRLYLMPDERRYLQSKCRKKTCNPKFEETYVFQVSHRALKDRVLKLTVYDVDRHKRHQVIGHALYPLREHDCESNVRLVIWRDLEKEVSESTTNKGDLLVSMCYNNHLERLTVGLYESKDLHYPTSMGQAMDTYAKVCLMTQNKLVKVKKTETVKKTHCPNFNESFTFKVPASSLDTASVSIAVMQYMSGHKDRLIGRIVLGSFMFARGKELEHWNQMIASQRDQISYWHTLS